MESERIAHLDKQMREGLAEMLASNQPVDSIAQLVGGYYVAIVELRGSGSGSAAAAWPTLTPGPSPFGRGEFQRTAQDAMGMGQAGAAEPRTTA